MAFEKTSEPGIITLSPTCKPEIDKTIDVSKVVRPVIFMERMVYSLGTFALCNASNSGSTEVTVVSVTCANEEEAITHKAVTRTRDKYRCMLNDSVGNAIDSIAVCAAN